MSIGHRNELKANFLERLRSDAGLTLETSPF